MSNGNDGIDVDKDIENGGDSSGFRGRKVTTCSFCGKTSREVGPMVEGPNDVYICAHCTDLCHNIFKQEKRKLKSGPSKPLFTKIPTPREITEFLDEYVIGQDQTKRNLSVAVHNHYKRLISGNDENLEVELEKSNVMMIGPTGSGKTLLARTMARLMNVPFAICDATTLTEAGYVGEDVENLLLKLLQAADFDLEEAQRGIIFIDEIDKIGRTTQNTSITRDVSGEGVQQSLLKMLEGTVANVPPQGGRKHPEQQYIQMDTTNILFICGGAFSGLEEIVQRRMGKKRIGFVADSEGEKTEAYSEEEALKYVMPEDILEFGLIPELVGRLPIITALMPLGEEALMRVLTEPKNALVRQYQHFFRMEDAELEFTEDALREIALRAIKRNTGARALRGVLEDIMLNLMYDLPDKAQKGARYILDKDTLDNNWSLDQMRTITMKESA